MSTEYSMPNNESLRARVVSMTRKRSISLEPSVLYQEIVTDLEVFKMVVSHCDRRWLGAGGSLVDL